MRTAPDYIGTALLLLGVFCVAALALAALASGDATMRMVYATLALACVAVFQSRIGEWLHRPKIELRIAPREDYLYPSLYVSNEKGWGPALDVQLVALSMKRTSPGSPAEMPPLPANFEWANQASHQRNLPVLPQGMVWRAVLLQLDFGSGGPGRSAKLDRCELSLASVDRGKHLLPQGDYVLHVRLAARNHKRVDATFKVSWEQVTSETRREAAMKGCKVEAASGRPGNG